MPGLTGFGSLGHSKRRPGWTPAVGCFPLAFCGNRGSLPCWCSHSRGWDTRFDHRLSRPVFGEVGWAQMQACVPTRRHRHRHRHRHSKSSSNSNSNFNGNSKLNCNSNSKFNSNSNSNSSNSNSHIHGHCRSSKRGMIPAWRPGSYDGHHHLGGACIARIQH